MQIASQLRPGVERTIDGTVGILTMRYPPHDLLEPTLSRMIVEALAWAVAEGARAVVVRSGLRHFSAGADLDVMVPAADDGDGVIDWPMLEVLRPFPGMARFVGR
jgi:enoyl-CoA hydratase/carnithine racemase